MDSDELGNELVRLEGGFLVDEETYVVNSDDVLGNTKKYSPRHYNFFVLLKSGLSFLHSLTVTEQEENNSDSNCGKNVPLREQDRFLPIANIAKIMKRAIPENGKVRTYNVLMLKKQTNFWLGLVNFNV